MRESWIHRLSNEGSCRTILTKTLRHLNVTRSLRPFRCSYYLHANSLFCHKTLPKKSTYILAPRFALTKHWAADRQRQLPPRLYGGSRTRYGCKLYSSVRRLPGGGFVSVTQDGSWPHTREGEPRNCRAVPFTSDACLVTQLRPHRASPSPNIQQGVRQTTWGILDSGC